MGVLFQSEGCTQPLSSHSKRFCPPQLRLAQVVSPSPRLRCSQQGANTLQSGDTAAPSASPRCGGGQRCPHPLCKPRVAPLLSGTIWGVFPPQSPQPIHRQAAPKPHPLFPTLHFSMEPPSPPEVPKGEMPTPKFRMQRGCDTQTPTIPGPPLQLTGTARLSSSRETQAKYSPAPALGLRRSLFFRCRSLQLLRWLRHKDARPVGIRPWAAARPGRARAHGGHGAAGGKLAFPASDLPAMNHCNLPPRFSPFLGSDGEQERSGFLENAAATGFIFLFFSCLSYSVPSGEAFSNPHMHTRVRSLAAPCPDAQALFHPNF